jgi:hypothetical protein
MLILTLKSILNTKNNKINYFAFCVLSMLTGILQSRQKRVRLRNTFTYSSFFKEKIEDPTQNRAGKNEQWVNNA